MLHVRDAELFEDEENRVLIRQIDRVVRFEFGVGHGVILREMSPEIRPALDNEISCRP